MVGYYLNMNSGYSSSMLPTFTQIPAATRSFTVTNLIAGATYQFRMAAYNVLEAQNKQFDDQLNFSDVVSFVIANEPDQITQFS